MSLHDALVQVVNTHLLLQYSESTATTLLESLNTDDKLFWYLGNEKKILKQLTGIRGKNKLKQALEEQYNVYIKKEN